MLLEWDSEEKLYVATTPTLAIGSYGVTRQEAMDKIREVAVVTIEGLRATGQVVTLSDAEPGSAVGCALYVGDYGQDAETAKRADVPFVGVLSGRTLRRELVSYAIVGILGDVSKLPELLHI